MHILLATVAAWTSLGTLALSSVLHGLRPGLLAGALGAQGAWPDRAQRPLAAVVILLEAGLGWGGLAVLAVGGNEETITGVLLGTAFLYSLYAIYSTFLLVRGSIAPCGCSPGDHPVNVWVPIRASALAAAAVLSASSAGRILPFAPPSERIGLAVIASVALGAILWSLPAAMHHPARTPARWATHGRNA